jgi:tetratricopeptide (TPR) repeat protein
MALGLDLLYKRNDPAGAVVQFRKVLELNPTHYGATFQLARALDHSGKPDEARPYWQRMLGMATAAKDETTLATVRKRLDTPAPSTEDPAQKALMDKGLDLLFQKKDPKAAAVEFRKVLQLNPAHYGATFQLARALDLAGMAAEARPLWEKVATMAERYRDQRTLAAARTRLAQKP